MRNLSFLFLVIASCAQSSIRSPSAIAQVKENERLVVSINSQHPLRALDSSFLGLSYEKDMISTPLFDSKNKPLVTLFSRLGHGVIRFGGNQVEKTTWEKNGPGNITKVVSPKDLDRLAGFIRATKWQIIYGINLGKNTPENAADEAAYATKVFGKQLIGFQIGNEPDLYYDNGIRPPTYTYQDFKNEWEVYFEAIRKRVPTATFNGPSSASPGLKTFAVPFARDEMTKINMLAQHYYRASGSSPSSTIDLLLDPDTTKLKPMLETLSLTANSTHVGFRMSECNSFYGGGAPGISNGFGTALWVIDFLFENAVYGSAGVNFHGGGDEWYTPIANNELGVVDGIRPEYYGLFLFAKAANGSLLQTKTENQDPHFSSYATTAKDGSFWIILSNKDRTKTFQATVVLDQHVTEAHSLILTAPSLDSTSDYTFGGSAIDVSGNWNPTYTKVDVAFDKINVNIPTGSVVLIHALMGDLGPR
jgi:hypothetical protein